MSLSTSFAILLTLVVALAVGSIALGGFAGKSSTRQTATGTILTKTHKPEGTYTQTPAGARREGFWTPTAIPIAEAYIFEIELDSPPGGTLRYSTNILLGRSFEKGHKVEIDYEVRGTIFGKRAYVLEMRRRASSSEETKK